MVYFDVESGKNYSISALLSRKKGCFLTKSQGKLFLGTAGNHAILNEANGAFQKKHCGKSKNTTISTLKFDVYCQKRQILSKTAIFIFADSASYRKKIVVFDNTCQKEQELSFLP